MALPIRVLNIFHRLMPSGAEVMWLNAAAEFRALGIEHVLLSVDQELGPFAAELEKEFEIAHLPLPGGPWGARSLSQAIKDKKADIVHCHSESKGAAAALAGRMTGRPAVRTYHNIWETQNPRHRARRLMERRFCKPVAIGASVQAVESYWGPLITISNWAKAGSTERPILDEGKIRLLTICNTNSLKRCDTMIGLVAKHPELDLTHVGFDEEGDFEPSKLAEAGLADRVRTLGFQNDPIALTRSFDAYVCTSEREGFSIAMTEALLATMPLAIVDTPGVRDFFQYQPAAFKIVVDATKPFEGLAFSIATQQQLYRERSPDLREHFSARRGALEYAQLYRELLAR